MNLSPLWVEAFEGHGFEATHWSQVGAPGAPDHDFAELLLAIGGRAKKYVNLADLRHDAPRLHRYPPTASVLIERRGFSPSRCRKRTTGGRIEYV